jgi:DNA repair exonuclease SbcCD nuclease subunit
MADDTLRDDTVRIVHAADIHLDSPMRGLGTLRNPELAAELRLSTRRAFDALIDYCLAAQPAALVIAGDLYDGDWKDYATGAYFAARMRDLADAGIVVVIARGNHDAESVITRAVTLPPNVHVLSAEEPQTLEFEDVGLAVHGQSFATRAVLTNLAQSYPDPVPGLGNVGALHTSVTGYEGHEPYAPCTRSDLTGRGYEYFALGHIHARQVLAEVPRTVAFSGNLQGRHIRENGPKGAWSVTLRPGQMPEREFVPLDVARWEWISVPVKGLDSIEELATTVSRRLDAAVAGAEGRALVTRVEVSGRPEFTCEPERLEAEVRAFADSHHIGVDKVTTVLQGALDPVVLPEQQRRLLGEAIADADAQELLRDTDLDELISEFGYDYLHPAGLDLRDRATLDELLGEATAELWARMDGGLA